MTPGQARPLLVLPTPTLQEEAAAEIIKHAMTAREAEELARTRTQKPVRRTAAPAKKGSQNGNREVEAELSAVLGTRVKVQERDPDSGVILIEYYSAEDLQRILEQLSGSSEMAAGGRSVSRRAAFPV